MYKTCGEKRKKTKYKNTNLQKLQKYKNDFQLGGGGAGRGRTLGGVKAHFTLNTPTHQLDTKKLC